MKWRISRVGLISSTQDAARSLAQSETHGRVVIAEAQTRGRGRHRRAWCSPPGGLYMTLMVPRVEEVELVPIMAGVSTAEAVREAYGLEANLKWPNDIIIEGGKLGGILTEVLWMKAKPAKILIGIGINVNNPLPRTLPTATSISSKLGGDVPLKGLIASLLDRVDENLEVLRDEPGELLRRWRSLSTTLNGRAEAYDGRRVPHGLAADVCRDGRLLLER